VTAPLGLPEASDAELVGLVLQADREAFAVVYDRYGPRLYDFAYSMLRQREDAADAVADSFVTFAEKLPQLREPDRLRPWLYAIVRSECLRRLKQRKRVSYADDEQLAEMADDAVTPEEAAEKAALQKLVWDAAAGLADRDRALLDLHLRQGLEGAELGEAMGVSASNAYVMLNRLKSQVDRSLGALLIARLGRDDCEELDKLLGDWDGSFSPLIRKRVARHVEGCSVCGERRKRILSPWMLLAGVPMFAAPAALRDRVVGDTELVAYVTPGNGGSGPAAPSGPSGPRGRGRWLVAAAVLLLLGTGGAVVLWPEDESPASSTLEPGTNLGGGTEQSTPTPATTAPTLTGTPTPTGATGLPSATAQTATAAPGALQVSTATIDLGATRTTGSFNVTNTGGTAISYLATSSAAAITVSPASQILDPGASTTVQLVAARSRLVEGKIAETISVTAGSLAAQVKVIGTNEVPPNVGTPRVGTSTCSGSNRTFHVTVVASDAVGVKSVKLIWSGADSGSAQMNSSPTNWSGLMGPMSVLGKVTVRAVATDARGNTATSAPRTIDATPCPQ